MRYKDLLLVSMIAGIAVAAIPFYAPLLRQALGIPEAAGKGWRGLHGEEAGACQYTLRGVVESVDPSRGVMVVAGREVVVRGAWRGPGGTVRWYELVYGLRGRSVEVCARETGVGLAAERIYVEGLGLFTRG